MNPEKEKQGEREIFKKIEERVSTLIREWKDIPEEVFQEVSEDKLKSSKKIQEALKENILQVLKNAPIRRDNDFKFVGVRDFLQSYVSLLAKETTQEMRKSSDFQSLLETKIIREIREGFYISTLFFLILAEETRKSPELQEAVKKSCIMKMLRNIDVSDDRILLLTKKTQEKFQNSSVIQDLLKKNFLKNSIEGRGIARLQLFFASEETEEFVRKLEREEWQDPELQKILKHILLEEIYTNQPIPHSFLQHLREETIADSDLQRVLREKIFRSIETGKKIHRSYLLLMDEETLSFLREFHNREIERHEWEGEM